MTQVDRRTLPSFAPMSRSDAATPLWRVKRKDVTVCCVLQEADDNAFLLSVTVNGDEIAARRYHTKLAAVGDAGFLLECLATEGWTVIVDVRVTTLQ